MKEKLQTLSVSELRDREYFLVSIVTRSDVSMDSKVEAYYEWLAIDELLSTVEEGALVC
jgi:hypothetical protein